MAGVKGGDYVLTASVYRQPDETGVRRRYRRGDTVTLNAEQAERLLAAGAIAKPSSDAAEVAVGDPGAPLGEGVPLPEVTPFTASSAGAALSNSGLGDAEATGGVLAEAQLAAPATELGTPPKSATADVWRSWAVSSGKATEDEAAGLNKSELQALAD